MSHSLVRIYCESEVNVYPDDEELEDIEQDHLDGLHFGSPEGLCTLCEIDDDDPEAPDDI